MRACGSCGRRPPPCLSAPAAAPGRGSGAPGRAGRPGPGGPPGTGEPPGADAPAPAPVTVRVEGPGVTTRRPFVMENPPPGGDRTAEVAVTVAAPYRPGSRLGVTAIAEGPGGRAELAAEITAAEPGWTIWMVCHFHYDPVWWNTQGGFTEAGLAMPGEDGGLPDVRTAFELVRLHPDAARGTPEYKFVLAEGHYR